MGSLPLQTTNLSDLSSQIEKYGAMVSTLEEDLSTAQAFLEGKNSSMTDLQNQIEHLQNQLDSQVMFTYIMQYVVISKLYQT